LPQDGAAAAATAAAPVPVARKTSLQPSRDDESDADDVDIRASPVKKVDNEEELTRDEWELSKRETVHLDEDVSVEKATHVNVVDDDDDISEADEEERQESESSSEEEAEVVEAAPLQTNGGAVHDDDDDHARHQSSSSGSEDEEPAPVEKEEKVPSPRRSLHVEQPPPAVNDEQRTPSPNAAKTGDVTKAYIASLNNNNNNASNDPVSKSERPTKSIKDISQMYVENISKSTPPASPKPVARAKPTKDITQLYTGKFEQSPATSPSVVDKLSPKKVPTEFNLFFQGLAGS